LKKTVAIYVRLIGGGQIFKSNYMGRLIAAKKFFNMSAKGSPEFDREVAILTQLSLFTFFSTRREEIKEKRDNSSSFLFLTPRFFLQNSRSATWTNTSHFTSNRTVDAITLMLTVR
jgi:hypothetical protein